MDCQELAGRFLELYWVGFVLKIFIILILLSLTVNTAKAIDFHAIAYAHKNHELFLGNQTNDLWVRIRSGFAIKKFDAKEVRHHETEYTRHPKYIYQMIERSKPYLYHIVEEVEQRGLPAEIVLLPLVESAFNPKAKSRSNALGLWQFIPSTGKSYGLTQNQWHDDRKDVIAATSAALDYLQKLHSIFDDWKLALAAYNWGKTAVRRSIAKNLERGMPADFQHIKLPDETRHHVYKLIAVRNIIAAPENFGIQLDAIANQPYFAKIEINFPINIEHATQLADISINEFQALNPAYKRGMIKIEDTPRILLLPIEKKEKFLRNFEIYSKLFKSPEAHPLKKDGHAIKTSMPRSIILTHLDFVNDIKKNKQNISGLAVPVPLKKQLISADINLVQKKPITLKVLSQRKNEGKKNFSAYIVKKGDTLYSIARRHGLTVEQIKSWNNSGEHLSIGQELMLLPETEVTIP